MPYFSTLHPPPAWRTSHPSQVGAGWIPVWEPFSGGSDAQPRGPRDSWDSWCFQLFGVEILTVLSLYQRWKQDILWPWGQGSALGLRVWRWGGQTEGVFVNRSAFLKFWGWAWTLLGMFWRGHFFEWGRLIDKIRSWGWSGAVGFGLIIVCLIWDSRFFF